MKDVGGRPKAVNEMSLSKLEEAFRYGASDVEACLVAEISPATLYNYQKEHPEFLERKQILKENPTMVARKSVVDKLPKDGKLALAYLERKKKKEFSLKTEMEHSGDIKVIWEE